MQSMEEHNGEDKPNFQRSPGQILRAAREAKGLHLGVLSAALKVPTRQLEALENDQYEAFKGITFARALAQTLCRHLGIDPAPVLAGLPKTTSPLLQLPHPTVEEGPPIDTHNPRGTGLTRQALLLALLMLMGAAALVWWPGTPWSDDAAPSEVMALPVPVNVPTEPANAAASPAGNEAASTSATAATPSTPSTAAPSTAAPSTAAPLAAPAAAPTSAPVVPSPAAAAAAPAQGKAVSGSAQNPQAHSQLHTQQNAASTAAPAPAPTAALASATARSLAAPPAANPAATAPTATAPAKVPVGENALQVRASADTWMTLRDIRGDIVFNRLLKAGESVKHSAVGPLFVYAARADALELNWRGQVLDLKPFIQNNELRMPLKP